jgi:hypothetical protein
MAPSKTNMYLLFESMVTFGIECRTVSSLCSAIICCRDSFANPLLQDAHNAILRSRKKDSTPLRRAGQVRQKRRRPYLLESELAAMKAEHDPLAAHIFISRRNYRNVNDTKSGKRREMMARLSFNTACELGNQPSRFAAWRFLLCSLTTNRSFPLIRHDRTCSSVDFGGIAVAPSDLEYNQGRDHRIAPIL